MTMTMAIYSHVTHIGVLEKFTISLNLSIKHCEIYNTNRINVNPYKITLSTIVRKIMMIMNDDDNNNNNQKQNDNIN